MQPVTVTLTRDSWWLLGTLAFIGLWWILWEAGNLVRSGLEYARAWVVPALPRPPRAKADREKPSPKPKPVKAKAPPIVQEAAPGMQFYTVPPMQSQ